MSDWPASPSARGMGLPWPPHEVGDQLAAQDNTPQPGVGDGPGQVKATWWGIVTQYTRE